MVSGVLASYEEDSHTIFLSEDLETEDARKFQLAVGRKLSV